MDQVGRGGHSSGASTLGGPGRPDPPDWSDPAWRLIAESIPHMVWVAAPSGRVQYFNQRGVDYLGGEAGTMSWEDMVHPDDLDRAHSAWRRAVEARTPYEEDVRTRRADGVYRWLAIRSQPVIGTDGVVSRWIGTATDIDGRKELEDHLVDAHREATEALALVSALQGAAPVGIGFVDRQLRVVRVNRELADLGTRPIEDQIGRTVAEAVPDLWGMLEPVYAHVLDTGEAVRNLAVTASATDDDHVRREWLCTFYPVRIEDEIIGVGVIVIDVTERIRAERFSSTVMNQIADGVYTQDGDGRLTYMNRAASRMLGWTEDELCGKRVHELVHFQRADGTPVGSGECALLTQGTERRLVHTTDEAFTRKDGSVFPVAYSSRPLRVGSHADGVSVVFRDLSDPATSNSPIRVVIADADRASAMAMLSMLTRHDGFKVVAAVATSTAAVNAARLLRPDVVILDVALGEVGGPATTLRIKAEAPDTSVLLVAVDFDEAVVAAGIAAGGVGVVDKRRMWVELASAVRAAYHGETAISQAELQRVVTKVRDTWRPGRAQALTTREREVLVCLTQGLSNQSTADRLGVSVNTVRNHVQRLLYKLDVHSKLEAVVVATRDGLLDAVPERGPR